MDMKRMRPHRSRAQELPGLPQQQEGPNPAKRPRLLDSSGQGCLAGPHLEEPSRPTSEELTSIVCLGADCTLELELEGVNLILEAQPTSVTQVSLPGHTIILVPQELQTLIVPAQPGSCPTGSREAALLDMPLDHGFICQPGSSRASLSVTEGLRSTSDPNEDPPEGGFLSPLPWMDAPAGLVPAFYVPFTGMPSPLFPGQRPCPDADRYAQGSIWSLKGSMLQPLPESPLQPLPPSPPQSHQERPQCPRKPPRSCCKARRRLF